jgi:hypothetical protein
VVPFVSGVIAAFVNDLDLDRFRDIKPDISLLLDHFHRKGVMRLSAIVTCICIGVISYRFFVFIGKREISRILSFVRYYGLVSALAACVGILGVVDFHDMDDQVFQMAMEFVFFYGAISFQISADVALKMIQIKLPLSIWAYDALSFFMAISCISLKMLTMVVIIEEAISLASLIEYLSYFLIFLKFPVMGWEMSLTSESKERDCVKVS